MPNMPETLCDACLVEGRPRCPFNVMIQRVEAMLEGAKGLADTPSHLGGNVEMAKWLQGVIVFDNAGLREEAEARGCTVFLAPPLKV